MAPHTKKISGTLAVPISTLKHNSRNYKKLPLLCPLPPHCKGYMLVNSRGWGIGCNTYLTLLSGRLLVVGYWPSILFDDVIVKLWPRVSYRRGFSGPVRLSSHMSGLSFIAIFQRSPVWFCSPFPVRFRCTFVKCVTCEIALKPDLKSYES